MERSSLIESIKAAFPLLPLPEISLHQALLSDDSMARDITRQEWREAGRSDAGRTWNQFDEQELISCNDALAHLDEASFAYYLPAFMLFAIKYCDAGCPHEASELVGTTVFSVTHRSPYSLSRFDKLSPSQRDAVISFLDHMSEHGDPYNSDLAVKSLRRYWRFDGLA